LHLCPAEDDCYVAHRLAGPHLKELGLKCNEREYEQSISMDKQRKGPIEKNGSERQARFTQDSPADQGGSAYF
jgi:hypothetical protein